MLEWLNTDCTLTRFAEAMLPSTPGIGVPLALRLLATGVLSSSVLLEMRYSGVCTAK